MALVQSDTERLLRDSTRRFLADNSGWQARRSGKAKASREAWAGMADLGWFGMAVPEASGGLGGTPGELLAILEEAGRALAAEPLLPNLMVPGPVLARLDPATVDAYVAGEAIFAFGGLGAAPSGARLVSRGGDQVVGITGSLLGYPAATHCVLAVHGPEEGEAAVVCLPAGAASPAVEHRALFDGSVLSTLEFREPAPVPGRVVARGGDARALIEEIGDRLAAGAAAEGLGAVDRAFRLTLDYLKQRTQFGQALAAFQAIQHMMAEAYCSLEQYRSLVLAAGLTLERGEAVRARGVSAAKACLGGRAREVVETCIQVSGGIGVTDEYELGHLYKRVLTRAALFGDADHHLARVAELARLRDAEARRERPEEPKEHP